jgi:hypothetical protein
MLMGAMRGWQDVIDQAEELCNQSFQTVVDAISERSK